MVAASARACFTASYAAHSCTVSAIAIPVAARFGHLDAVAITFFQCVLQRTWQSSIIYDTVLHSVRRAHKLLELSSVGRVRHRRVWIRSESCLTPLTFPHHFTSCLYTQDLATLNLKPIFAVSSSISCNLSRYTSMSAAYSSQKSIQTSKCLYSSAAKHRSIVDWKHSTASALPWGTRFGV
ncbi:hypothetical protein PF010_g12654 [Phytophthora fragariae]|uniref:Uncharacterized protein n=1 Tax=Phytophthora fragariae TaxID=53985 RepID=A0A6A3K1G0_9STRA|nr:hypothetical protein PF011_g13974 [Phytophthora fragariae]KAE9106365.1 hypothetical protein PF010_g12654 [Phytophthora fragariae]KAE9224425.1 hypothetical protein PF004_g12222 [Phytophthora fragariae]KAE9337652.1 hypothetical protein PF008_g12432 [Phytophthora fragariae]